MSFPSQQANPKGLHLRYIVSKASGQPVDPKADYLVFRIDDGGSDPQHINAGRIAGLAYANAIEHHLPNVAADIRARLYPTLAATPPATPATGGALEAGGEALGALIHEVLDAGELHQAVSRAYSASLPSAFYTALVDIDNQLSQHNDKLRIVLTALQATDAAASEAAPLGGWVAVGPRWVPASERKPPLIVAVDVAFTTPDEPNKLYGTSARWYGDQWINAGKAAGQDMDYYTVHYWLEEPEMTPAPELFTLTIPNAPTHAAQ